MHPGLRNELERALHYGLHVAPPKSAAALLAVELAKRTEAAGKLRTEIERMEQIDLRYSRLYDLFVDATGYEPSGAELGDES